MKMRMGMENYPKRGGQCKLEMPKEKTVSTNTN